MRLPLSTLLSQTLVAFTIDTRMSAALDVGVTRHLQGMFERLAEMARD